jgi:hypothetical protein
MECVDRFMHGRGIHADFAVPQACLDFAKQQGLALLQQNLRVNFMMHLLALWEWGLVTQDSINECMVVINTHAGGLDSGAARREHAELLLEEQADCERDEHRRRVRRRILGNTAAEPIVTHPPHGKQVKRKAREVNQ